MARTKKEPSIVVDYDSLGERYKNLYKQLAAPYEEMNIFALRKIATDLGVESPTTLDKKTLVKRVTDRVIMQYLPTGTSGGNTPWNIFKDISGEETVRGLCEYSKGEWYIGRVNILPVIAKEHSLRDGDIVEGAIAEVDGLKMLVSLTSAENEGIRRKWFIDIPVSERRPYSIDGTKADELMGGLHVGERVIMKNMSVQDAYDIADSFENSIKLLLGLAPEYESNLDSSTFISNFDLSKEQTESVVHLAMERCKRLAEVGKDVAFVIKGFDFLDEYDLERALFGMGRCFSRGGVTVIAEMDKTRRNGIFAKIATRIL